MYATLGGGDYSREAIIRVRAIIRDNMVLDQVQKSDP